MTIIYPSLALLEQQPLRVLQLFLGIYSLYVFEEFEFKSKECSSFKLDRATVFYFSYDID